jgi:hypothetical protein
MLQNTLFSGVAVALLGCASSCSGSGGSAPPGPGTVVYQESFDGADGAPWPTPWSIPVEASSPILDADIQGGRARLRGTTSNVARMLLPTPAMQDFSAVFRVEFENIAAQGIGFYGRQNGGRLQATAPTGQGLAVFVKGFGGQAIGLWHELDGVETLDVDTANPLGVGGIVDGVEYLIRFEVEQIDATQTELRARVWAAGSSEPAGWQVSFASSLGVVQNIADGFAIDIYNNSGTGSVYVDDLIISAL